MTAQISSHTVAELLSKTIHSGGSGKDTQPIPTGFTPLDDILSGGLRPTQFVLLAGRPGVGKTILALQWARAFALGGQSVVFVCYEHSPRELLDRLLTLEVRSAARSDEDHLIDTAATVLRRSISQNSDPSEIDNNPLAQEALLRISSYASLLTLVSANGRTTDIDAIQAIAETAGEGSIIFVDYLQKVPVDGNLSDDERSGSIAESLKDIAMSEGVLVIATAAGDRSGIAGRRFRLADLRGSSSLAYECDVAIVLNEKTTAISKVALAYNTGKSVSFDRQVIFSVEKNRSGPSNMNIEFAKDFRYYRFEPDGGFLAEKMLDDVLYEE